MMRYNTTIRLSELLPLMIGITPSHHHPGRHAPFKLSSLQADILICLWNGLKQPGLSQVARHLNWRIATVAGAVDILVQKGYVIKGHKDKQWDSRTRPLLLTDQGTEKAVELAEQPHIEAILSKFCEDELHDLYCVIGKLLKAAESQSK